MANLQSYMSCVNEPKKCNLLTPIQYEMYDDYKRTLPNDDNMKRKLEIFVCGTKIGKVTQCCDKTVKNANEIVNDGPRYKEIKNSKGEIIEYQLCNCKTELCKKEFCPDTDGFKQVDNYMFCKTNASDPKQIRKVNPYINSIVASNTYPDCYALC